LGVIGITPAETCKYRFITTSLSYRFPIFETSATAFCGTTGILANPWTSLFWRRFFWHDHFGFGVFLSSAAVSSPSILQNYDGWRNLCVETACPTDRSSTVDLANTIYSVYCHLEPSQQLGWKGGAPARLDLHSSQRYLCMQRRWVSSKCAAHCRPSAALRHPTPKAHSISAMALSLDARYLFTGQAVPFWCYETSRFWNLYEKQLEENGSNIVFFLLDNGEMWFMSVLEPSTIKRCFFLKINN